MQNVLRSPRLLRVDNHERTCAAFHFSRTRYSIFLCLELYDIMHHTFQSFSKSATRVFSSFNMISASARVSPNLNILQHSGLVVSGAKHKYALWRMSKPVFSIQSCECIAEPTRYLPYELRGLFCSVLSFSCSIINTDNIYFYIHCGINCISYCNVIEAPGTQCHPSIQRAPDVLASYWG